VTERLARALDRTMLLMRDELCAQLNEASLLEALSSTEIVIVADRANLKSHSAQTAYVTAAMLMARSGHRVYLVAPDLPLVGAQPPLPAGGIIGSLLAIGPLLLPGVALRAGRPGYAVDLELRLGDTRSSGPANRSIALSAKRWSGRISSAGARWPDLVWILGALAAAALGAGEAFKAAMWKLGSYACNPTSFAALFAACDSVEVQLAPEDAPAALHLGAFDVISAGAIANGFLYCLVRILDATGAGRILDSDQGDLTNMNRNVLVLLSDTGDLKVDVLAQAFRGSISLQALPMSYDQVSAPHIGALAQRVVVGVDHIPTRWVVQGRWPGWLGIGATSHWSAMASFHTKNLACARCLHPTDDPIDAPIPTVSFVSFWSGLLLATYFLQSLGGRGDLRPLQQTYITPLRPELPWRTPITRRPACPLCAHRKLAAK
jgi:hypothetical protein